MDRRFGGIQSVTMLIFMGLQAFSVARLIVCRQPALQD
jgi:hypothetical protein